MSYGCAQCRQLEPALRQVAQLLDGRLTVFRVNVPVDSELSSEYGAHPQALRELNPELDIWDA